MDWWVRRYITPNHPTIMSQYSTVQHPLSWKVYQDERIANLADELFTKSDINVQDRSLTTIHISRFLGWHIVNKYPVSLNINSQATQKLTFIARVICQMHHSTNALFYLIILKQIFFTKRADSLEKRHEETIVPILLLVACEYRIFR